MGHGKQNKKNGGIRHALCKEFTVNLGFCYSAFRDP
jgi:hypothetical protein